MELSKAQKEIVDSTSKKIIVDAGSGSGKTRVLTERVRKILNSRTDPRSVVVITFTNMAANELKERLSEVKGSERCFIGTIHSYANSLLKDSGLDYEIFSEEYQTMFMKQLIEKYGYYSTFSDYELFLKCDKQVAAGRMSKNEVRQKFSDYKVYDEILALLGRSDNKSVKETVVTLCKENNIITFDELIELATDYFKRSKIKLEYLFVDELQDIGYLEYNFLLGLNAENYFVIGDDFQSIFGFKGGDVNIFLSLMHSDDWKSYFLSENYRTAKSILLYANAIISKADNIIKKDVVCKNENLGSLEFNAKSLVDKFLGDLKEDDDWFILTRSNKEMNMVDAMLTKAGKEHYCFKQSTTSQKKVKEILSKPCIKVMTIHASKGMECENVALYGKLPVKGTGDSEELKVYYVGITRSKNRCVIFV